MSFDPSAHPELIDKMRQQIRTLAGEVAQLSRSNVAPEQFYEEFLGRVVTALAAIGGAVWVLEGGRRLALAHQVNLAGVGLPDGPEQQQAHGRLLERVLAEGEGLLSPPHSGGQNGQGGNPTECLLVLAPLKNDSRTTGVVEIFQRPGAAAEVQRGYLQFLRGMCDLAGDFLKSHQLRQFSDRQSLWTQLEDFTCLAHAALDSRQIAYTIANEGRRLVQCDRLSVAIRRGRTCVIESVSGQDVLDKRSNTVRLLGRLATAVVATEEPLWYSGDTTDLAPQVEQIVQEYVDQTHTKTVGVLPLWKRPPAEDEDPDEDNEPPVAIGALIVEQIEDSRLPPGMLQRVEAVSRHASLALANALEHEDVPLLSVWRRWRRSRWILAARTLPKTVAVLVAALAVLGWLAFWPADLEIHTKGTLEPVRQQDVFAGVDGRVEKVCVDHRDPVEGPDPATGGKGTLLVVLRNNELEAQMARLSGERSTLYEQITAAQRALLEEKHPIADRNRLAAQLGEWKEELRNLDAQWAILEKKHEELSIHSPTGGQVITWDVRNLLQMRPVRRGQRLLEIARTDGPWQLVLRMPEDRMGHIARAQKELRDRLRAELAAPVRSELGPQASPEAVAAEVEQVLDEPSHERLHKLLGPDVEDRLPVSFVLATDPGSHYEGTVREIQLSADVRGEEGNTVLIKVEIDKSQLPHLMPGAEVSAKVDCGRCSVGYDLLHDLFAWVERLWFRL